MFLHIIHAMGTYLYEINISSNPEDYIMNLNNPSLRLIFTIPDDGTILNTFMTIFDAHRHMNNNWFLFETDGIIRECISYLHRVKYPQPPKGFLFCPSRTITQEDFYHLLDKLSVAFASKSSCSETWEWIPMTGIIGGINIHRWPNKKATMFKSLILGYDTNQVHWSNVNARDPLAPIFYEVKNPSVVKKNKYGNWINVRAVSTGDAPSWSDDELSIVTAVFAEFGMRIYKKLPDPEINSAEILEELDPELLIGKKGHGYSLDILKSYAKRLQIKLPLSKQCMIDKIELLRFKTKLSTSIV